MEKEKNNTSKWFGLIGHAISYSFSKAYFTEKFKTLQLHHYHYANFDIATIADFPSVIKQYPNLQGLNVTIPYKESIIPYLEGLSKEAAHINAVNTIKFAKEGLIGYNTDYYGFKKAIIPLLKMHHKKALILGTGGAAKAVVYALEELKIPYSFVARGLPDILNYTDLNKEIIEEHLIIINCTPLGTAPEIEQKPNLPYHYITSAHLLYDLVYNPLETTFLKLGKKQGAVICNGLQMLHFQAEKAWKLWNS
jgi:shikimate dehydrogenase